MRPRLCPVSLMMGRYVEKEMLCQTDPVIAYAMTCTVHFNSIPLVKVDSLQLSWKITNQNWSLPSYSWTYKMVMVWQGDCKREWCHLSSHCPTWSQIHSAVCFSTKVVRTAIWFDGKKTSVSQSRPLTDTCTAAPWGNAKSPSCCVIGIRNCVISVTSVTVSSHLVSSLSL